MLATNWSASCSESNVMPTAINEYGIHSGGAHDDDVVWWSTQASRSKVHDFHAKKAQNARLIRSTSTRRTRLARAESNVEIAEMPMWPRLDCTNAPHMKVAPTRQNTAASSVPPSCA